MISHEIIFTVFRLINVALLGIVFSEVFRRVLYPLIKKQITDISSAIKNIYEHIAQAKNDYATLQTTLVLKKDEAALLLHKVKQWRLYAQREHERYTDECNIRAQVMGVTRREQEVNFIATAQQRTLGPRIIARTKSMLIEEFSQEQTGTQFLVHLCHWVERQERRV